MATSTLSSYDTENDLMCGICKNTMKDAMQNTCGHCFCKYCIFSALEASPEDSVQCISCARENEEKVEVEVHIVTIQTIMPNYTIRKIIMRNQQMPKETPAREEVKINLCDHDADIDRQLHELSMIKLQMQNARSLYEQTLSAMDSLLVNSKETERKRRDVCIDRQYTWVIENYENTATHCCPPATTRLKSPIFLTSPEGYSLQLKVAPYGDDLATRNKFSLFMRIVSGPYDDMLQWPFKKIVTFTIWDTVRLTHLSKTFHNDNLECLSKPKHKKNNKWHGFNGVLPSKDISKYYISPNGSLFFRFSFQ